MSAREVLAPVVQAYADAYRAGDAEGCAACFTHDARLLSPYARPTEGRAAIAALHADWVTEGEDKTMEILDCGLTGTLGWALAEYAEGAATGTGTSLCVFQRGADGDWRIHMCSLNERDPS